MPLARKRRQGQGPGWEFGREIVRGMEQKGIRTHEALAQLIGMQRSAVTQLISGSKRQVSAATISALASALDLDGGVLLKLREGDTKLNLHQTNVAGSLQPNAIMQNEVAPADLDPPSFQAMPRNVPVLGTAVGGPDGTEGTFVMNGDIVEYVRRPPGCTNAANVFAIWLTGESMAPRFLPGDLLYIHPGRQPRIGDDVLIELQPTAAGERPAFVKRLVKRTETEIVVEQFNPPMTFSLDARAVLRIQRILTTAELMGV